MLQPRFAAGVSGRADLLVRVHVLPFLRAGDAQGAMPQLRRRARRAPAAAGGKAAEIPRIERTSLQAEWVRMKPDAKLERKIVRMLGILGGRARRTRAIARSRLGLDHFRIRAVDRGHLRSCATGRRALDPGGTFRRGWRLPWHRPVVFDLRRAVAGDAAIHRCRAPSSTQPRARRASPQVAPTRVG
jgi:hypothetical protein